MDSPQPPVSAERTDDEAKAESARHDTAEIPVTVGDMRKAFRINELWTVLVAIAAAGAAVLGAYRVFISEARAAGVETASSIERRMDVVEAAQKDVQLDMRSLYRAVLTGQRQERLEKAP